MTGLLGLLRIEALQLLRTREIHLFGLLPAVLFVPVYGALVLMVVSVIPDPQIVVPTEDPGFEVELDGYQVTRSDEPGDAEVVITSWGLRDQRLYVEARAPERDQRLASVLASAYYADLDARIEAAGGKAPDARLPTEWGSTSNLPLSLLAMALQGWVSFAAYLACFLIPARTTEERLAGVTEALASTRTPLLSLLVARCVVGVALCGSIVAIPGLFVLALVPAELLELSFLRWHGLPEGVSVLSMYVAAQVAVGAFSGSTRTALSYGSMVALTAMALGAAGALLELPTWPLLGLGRDAGALALALRMVLPVGVAIALLLISSAWLRYERVLPPGHSDE